MSHKRTFSGGESEDSEDEIEPSFNMGRKGSFKKKRVDTGFKFFKKKKEKESAEKRADIAMMVEKVLAALEVAAEEDAELNRQSKPAVNKLKKLPLLIHFLLKRGQVQWELLDHGILGVLKNWLEPLPDGSLPNLTIRSTILDMLTNYPINLELHHRREQVKKSGLGKAILFIARLEEETSGNRRLAKNLVEKWSRAIFDRTKLDDDDEEEEKPYCRRPRPPSSEKPAASEPVNDPESVFDKFRQGGSKAYKFSSSERVSRPEPSRMDFKVRPQSKVDPDKVRVRPPGSLVEQGQIKLRVSQKLKQLKVSKMKPLMRATACAVF